MFLVVLAIALTAAVGGGAAVIALEDSSSNLLTIHGTVVRAEWNPEWNVSTDIQVRTANNTTYNVDLGPPWWWAQQKYPTIHVNDSLTVTGVAEDDHEGNESAELTAYTISINGGSTITLRSGGMPPWAEARAGEHENDSENETDD